MPRVIADADPRVQPLQINVSFPIEEDNFRVWGVHHWTLREDVSGLEGWNEKRTDSQFELILITCRYI